MSEEIQGSRRKGNFTVQGKHQRKRDFFTTNLNVCTILRHGAPASIQDEDAAYAKTFEVKYGVNFACKLSELFVLLAAQFPSALPPDPAQSFSTWQVPWRPEDAAAQGPFYVRYG